MRDYHVRFTREETLAESAYAWREADGTRSANSFDIVKFVETTLRTRLRKGSLKIEVFERDFKQDDPAYVSFDPLTLHVAADVWAAANDGEPFSVYVIAHEIGHVIHHDNSAKAFSIDPQERLRFAQEEYSAEWQANTFAGYFLVPDDIAEKLDSAYLISVLCNVPQNLAVDRLRAVRERRARVMKKKCIGEACSECGNFTMAPYGTGLMCTNCRAKVQYLKG